MSKKLFALLMALVLVVGMSSVAMAAPCDKMWHQSWAQTEYYVNTYDPDYVLIEEATCDEAEVRGYKCPSCKEVAFTMSFGDPLGHDVVNGKCVNCQKSMCPACYSTSIHTNKKSYVAPTCNTDGKQDYDCLKCKTEWQVTFPKLGGAHSWIEYPELSVPSTCVERGLKGEQCKKCGYTRTIDALLNPKNHAHIKTVPEVPATCNATGLEAYEMCADCETKITEPNVIPKSTEHSDVITHTKKATCSAEGSITTYCDLCEEVLSTEVLPKLKHTFVDGACTVCGAPCTGWFHNSWAQTDEYKHLFNKDTIDATCSAPGKIWYKCVDCGGRVFYEETPELDHTLSFWYEYDETKHWQNCVIIGCNAKNLEEAEHTFVRGACTVCEYKCTEHEYEWKVTVEPTCTTDGLKEKRCTKCNYLGNKNKIPAGHKNLVNHPGAEANCVDAGSYHVFCTDCNTYVQENVPTEKNPNNHKNVKTFEGKDVSCTEPGATAHDECLACGIVITEKSEIAVDKTKHGELQKVVHAHANCVDAERYYMQCVDCNAFVGEEQVGEKDPTNHKEVKTFEGKAATCTEPGVTAHDECLACGIVITEKTETEIDKDNHNFVDGVCSRCGAADPDYVKPEEPKPECKHENLKRGYKHNDEKHWKICADCEDAVNEAAHRFNRKGVCICGAEKKVAEDNERPTRPDHNKRCRHDWIVGATVEANCKYEGSVVYMCAKGCGAEYTETTPVDYKNHSYGDDNVCDNCGKTKRCHHDWIVGATVEANCKYEGSVVYMCAKGCGAEYTETTPVNYKNHNYGDDNTCVDCGKVKRCRHEWIVGATVEANCKHEGSVVYMCAKGCGAEYTETTEINARNHNYGDDNTCDDCGKIKRSHKRPVIEMEENEIVEEAEETEDQGSENVEQTERPRRGGKRRH